MLLRKIDVREIRKDGKWLHHGDDQSAVKEECEEIFQDAKGFSNDFRVTASVRMFMRSNSSCKLSIKHISQKF